MNLTIRRATSDDAAVVADLAERIFRDTFGPKNRPEDIELHARQRYGPDKQRAEIEDPSLTYLIAEVDGEAAGFAMIGLPRSASAERFDKPIELFRFYVDKEWHGKGIAVPMMDACYDEARRRGGKTIMLNVWQENPRAIRFYEKIGYRIEGTTPYILGGDVQTDWIMVREIPS